MSGHAYTAGVIAAGRTTGRPARPRPQVPLTLAGLCLVALALTWAVAALLPAGQVKDSVALYHFVLLGRPRVDLLANALLNLLDPIPFVCWGIALVAVALVRERPRLAVAAVGVMALAPVTADALKPLLAHPHVQVGAIEINAASWPSGHSAAALALALSAVLVAPARMRVLVAVLGGAFAAAVGCSLLILAWHMPSDVFGGYLVAALWMALALAGLGAAERRWPSPGRSTDPQELGGRSSEPWAPGSHSDSEPSPAPSSVLTARLRMNSRSERRFR
jgi:membrane-associated phospholipid phosphatase